eukprot:jgi/Mesvir1/20875/Mv07955-RA.1
MPSYLEEFIEGLSSLPPDLHRNFTLMRELDERSRALQSRIEEACQHKSERASAYTRTSSKDNDAMQGAGGVGGAGAAGAGPGGEEGKAGGARVQEDQQACMEIADEKIALAVQTYDLVDAHIQKLDKDLRKFEEEMKREKRRKGAAGGTDGSDGGGDGTPRQKSKKNKEAGTPKRKRGSTGQLKGLRADLDLPVDPNEPTYCYCNRCIIEWFHFECVGLTTEQRPKGKWYCPDCTARMQGLGIAQVRK